MFKLNLKRFQNKMELMEFYFIFTQAVGFIAFALSLVSYQFKNQSDMYVYNIGANVFWVAHYLMLSVYTAAFTIFIGTLRVWVIVFGKCAYKKSVVFINVFIVALVCMSLPNEGVLKYAPIFCAALFGLSTYFKDHYWHSRIMICFGYVCWFIIGFLSHSYAEMLSSAFNITFLIIGFCRHNSSEFMNLGHLLFKNMAPRFRYVRQNK